MKVIILGILLILQIVSCGMQVTIKTNGNKITKSLWSTDSIITETDRYSSTKIFITKNFFWRFNEYNSPMLLDSAFAIRNDSVFKNKKHMYILQNLDNQLIFIKAGKGPSYIANNNKPDMWNSTEYKQDFIRMLTRDSLSRRVKGWWKLKSANYRPIHLHNNPVMVNDFTLYLNNNGRARFYIDHKIDSIEYYGWTTNIDGLSFSRGCISDSESKIFHLTATTMQIIFQDPYDTLVLQRCKPLIND